MERKCCLDRLRFVRTQGGAFRESTYAGRVAAEVLGRSIPLRQTDQLRRENPGLLQLTLVSARAMDMRAGVESVADSEFVLGWP